MYYEYYFEEKLAEICATTKKTRENHLKVKKPSHWVRVA
jgi:hypothetical protein